VAAVVRPEGSRAAVCASQRKAAFGRGRVQPIRNTPNHHVAGSIKIDVAVRKSSACGRPIGDDMKLVYFA
jgi:hypothetical protein